ncbi:hypothetical protein BJX64DRAFT_289074 [Aspergillus heterothallicus]
MARRHNKRAATQGTKSSKSARAESAAQCQATAGPSQRVTIHDLPPELIDQVCVYLDRDLMASLRLASKALSLYATHNYYSQVLEMQIVDLTGFSLYHLAAIAEDESMAPHVKSLFVAPEMFRRYGLLRPPELWTFDENSGDLLLPQFFSDALQEIVCHLPNCKALHFLQTPAQQSDAGYIRRPTIADALAIILPAAVEANMRPTEFFFISNEQSQRDLHALSHLDPLLPSPQCAALWSRLESLCLHFDNLLEEIPPTDLALHILPHVPRLQALELTFDRRMRSEQPAASASRILNAILGDHSLAFRLEFLALGNAFALDGGALREFLVHHAPTLRDLSLSGLHLTRGSWTPIFEVLGAPKAFPHLESICLDRLSQSGSECRHVCFCDVLQDRIVDEETRAEIESSVVDSWQAEHLYECVEYQGSKMGVALGKIARGATLAEAHEVHFVVG